MTKTTVRGAAIWSMASQYVAFFTQFATSVIVARFFLAPAEVGLFGTALAFAMLLATLQDFGITRYIAGHAAIDDEILRRCFSVSIVIAGAIGVAIAALAWPIVHFYGNDALFPILLVIAGSYLLVPFGIVPAAVLQRRLDFRALFFINIAGTAAMSATVLTLAALGWSSLSLAWGTVANAGARALLGQWFSGERPRLPLTLKHSGEIMRFGSGASLLYVTGALGYRTPELIVGKLLGFAAVGLFGRAVGLAGTLRQLVSGAIGGVFFPAFARMRDEGADFAQPYMRVVSAYSVTTWPAMLFLAAASAPVVETLFGKTWAGVAPLLMWIAISEIIWSALPLHMDIPIVLGRMRRLLVLNIADTAIAVALLVAASMISLEAAAASRLAYAVLWFALYAGFMKRLIAFRWNALAIVYVQSMACAIATIVPLVILCGGLRVPADLGFVTLALAAIAGVLGWAAMLFVVRHPARLEFIEIAQGAFTKLRAMRSR